MTAPWFLQATGQSESGARMRAVDWAATPAGPPETWPEPVRGAVRACLTSPVGGFVMCGPHLSLVFNDRCAAGMGAKAQWAMGVPAHIVMHDYWEVAEPIVDRLRRTGKAEVDPALRLVIGPPEARTETYLDFVANPIIDAAGECLAIVGAFLIVTDQVIAARRLRLLRDLSVPRLAAGMRVIRECADIVAADVFLAAPGGAPVRQDSTHPGEAPPPSVLPLVLEVMQAGRPLAAGHCLVSPLSGPYADAPIGATILEASPLRPFDDDCRAFLDLVAAALGWAAVADAERERQVAVHREVSTAMLAAMVPTATDPPGWHARQRSADARLVVGGDWYEVVSRPDGTDAVLIGAGAGTGLEAVTRLGRLPAAGRALLLRGHGPAETLRRLDRFASRTSGAESAAVLCAVVDPAAGRVTYSRTGARARRRGGAAGAARTPLGLVVGPGGRTWLDDARGLPLAGGADGAPRPEVTVALGPADVLVLATAGALGLDPGAPGAPGAAARREDLGAAVERLMATSPPGAVADALIGRGGRAPSGDAAIVIYRRPERAPESDRSPRE